MMNSLCRNFSRILSHLPVGMLSAVLIGAVLWLTLASKPLGDDAPSFFPGADKIAHALMFGAIAGAVMLDWQRAIRRRLPAGAIIAAGIGAAAFGAATEWMQDAMHAGRAFEWADMAADAAGAAIATLCALLMRRGSSENNNDNTTHPAR